MGSLGVSMGTGMATLIDINGDALPDVIDTSDDGRHRFFINTPSADGTSSFNTTPVLSDRGLGTDFRLSAPGIQVLDADGDGFTDLLDATRGQILYNKGLGDWLPSEDASGTSNLAQELASMVASVNVFPMAIYLGEHMQKGAAVQGSNKQDAPIKAAQAVCLHVPWCPGAWVGDPGGIGLLLSPA